MRPLFLAARPAQRHFGASIAAPIGYRDGEVWCPAERLRARSVVGETEQNEHPIPRSNGHGRLRQRQRLRAEGRIVGPDIYSHLVNAQRLEADALRVEMTNIR